MVIFVHCSEKQQKTAQSNKLQIIAQESPTSASIRGISVVDQQTVWMSGSRGVILKSTDAGNNWELVASPDGDSLDFRSIFAFSENQIIVASAGFPARIYRTENSGSHWQLVYENLDSAAFINSILFKNSEEGIAFGDAINGRHLILLTEDGGQNWKVSDSSLLPTPLKIEHGFAASGSCIALNKNGQYVIGLGGEKSRVFLSTDSGNWQTYPSKMISGSPTRGIYALSAGKGKLMAVGGDYTLADTSFYPTFSVDGGKSWQLTKSKVNGYRSTIDFVDRFNAWVCGGTNGIDYSFDQGESWINLPEVNVNSLRFDDVSGLGWAAGEAGKIYQLKFEE